MLLKFNQVIGSGGRTDMFRVTDADSNVPNDLDPRVLFSSFWVVCRYEKFEITVTGFTGNSVAKQTGSVLTSRKYAAVPMILAAYRNSGGSIVLPFYDSWVTDQLDSSSYPTSTVVNVRNQIALVMKGEDGTGGKYRVSYTVEQYGRTPLTNGVLRIFVIGKAIGT